MGLESYADKVAAATTAELKGQTESKWAKLESSNAASMWQSSANVQIHPPHATGKERKVEEGSCERYRVGI